MEYISLVFSLLFLSLIPIYLYWGIYIIKLNKKAKENRVFLAICVVVSIWSLGFAMANSAVDINAALFWRRVSAIGWTSVYSLMLHFLILLSHKNLNPKQIKLLGLLHVPAVISMYIFSFSNKLAMTQYNLIKIDLGWTNRSIGDGLDLFFRFYYISYILLSILLVWRWQKRLEDRKIAKKARLIIYSLIASGVLGTVTDIVMTSLLNKPIPQLGPIFILLPSGAMYYLAKYYGLINNEYTYKQEIIATEDDKKRIFNNIVIAFFIAGILNLAFEYLEFIRVNKISFSAGVIRSSMFFVTGTIIYMIQKTKKLRLKETLTVIVLVANIPIITFSFLEYASITVWVFPVIIIITSLVFSKRRLLISTTIVSILTQIIIWIIKPKELVQVDGYDYILRIIMFILAFMVGFYVNKIYVKKIQENAYQIEFQKKVSEISFDFVNLNQKNFENKVNNLLEKMGEFFNVDRTYLFIINPDKETMRYSNEWCKRGINQKIGNVERIPLDLVPWCIDQLNNNKLAYIEDVNKMPKEASADQEQLHRRDVKSLVAVPILIEGKMQGFIGIESVTRIKKWTKENIEMLNIMANILSSGFLQIKADKEIEFMAYYDNLTKLPNRFLFEDRVNQAIELSKRTGNFISIIFIDLDNFKSVNDTIGHKGGDRLLEQVAENLVRVLRKTDTVARFGGDEFMIMLNNLSDQTMIAEIADKVMEIFSETFIINEQEFLVTASAGISIYPVDGKDSATLIKNADIAMYNAKDKGKNQYAICTDNMKKEVEFSMELSNDIYYALKRNELVVYYQPQVDLITKQITGAEALLRWKHPTRGMISPGIFIPIAEKNSLINSIGDWVLREACIQNKKWQDKGLPPIKMAINLSAIQMLNPRLSSNVEGIIKKTGLNPKYIELEITESIAIKETNYIVEVLNKLKKIGLSIAIDDFGTEYSSLSRIKMLPIDNIKIDMQFIQGIESNEKDKAITMVIINLAKSLGLNVLAEGVETEQQLDFLNQKMCDNVQGYYYYKPMPAEEMEKILFDLSKADTKHTIKKSKLKPITES